MKVLFKSEVEKEKYMLAYNEGFRDACELILKRLHLTDQPLVCDEGSFQQPQVKPEAPGKFEVETEETKPINVKILDCEIKDDGPAFA